MTPVTAGTPLPIFEELYVEATIREMLPVILRVAAYENPLYAAKMDAAAQRCEQNGDAVAAWAAVAATARIPRQFALRAHKAAQDAVRAALLTCGLVMGRRGGVSDDWPPSSFAAVLTVDAAVIAKGLVWMKAHAEGPPWSPDEADRCNVERLRRVASDAGAAGDAILQRGVELLLTSRNGYLMSVLK